MASIMADDWLCFGDVTGCVLDGEEQAGWNEPTVDKLEFEWSTCERSSVTIWSPDVIGQLENDGLDTPVNPLPSPLEKLWVDFSLEYVTDNVELIVQPSVLDDEGGTVDKLPDVGGLSEEADACTEMEEVLHLLLQEGDMANFEDQVLTVDSSQLETLLSDSVGFDDLLTTCDVDHFESLSETQQESHSECDEHEENSDWSYSGERKRRRCTNTQRQLRTMPYRRPSGTVRFDRKKEQNKTAATRYRDRKRAEEIDNELLCAELEKRNRELRAGVEAMTHEASVLRKLIVDIFRNGSPTDS